ncbi:MAG: Mini-ribonuclease 3 [Bilifractor sp.]
MEESLNFLDAIGKKFDLPGRDPVSFSPLTLAYIGDAAYEMVVRTVIVRKGNAPVNKLNRRASELSCAGRQSKMIRALKEELTEEERKIYKRGRNATSHTKAKNASTADYRRATGFEAVIGYLYLCGRTDRMMELIRTGMERTQKNDHEKNESE